MLAHPAFKPRRGAAGLFDWARAWTRREIAHAADKPQGSALGLPAGQAGRRRQAQLARRRTYRELHDPAGLLLSLGGLLGLTLLGLLDVPLLSVVAFGHRSLLAFQKRSANHSIHRPL